MLGPGPSRDYGGRVQDRSVRSLLESFDAVSAQRFFDGCPAVLTRVGWSRQIETKRIDTGAPASGRWSTCCKSDSMTPVLLGQIRTCRVIEQTRSACGTPVVGKQLVDAAVQMGGQAGQHIGDVGPWIVPLQPG